LHIHRIALVSSPSSPRSRDLPSVDRRLAAVAAKLPAQAFLAAQQQLHFDAVLHAYTSVIELSNAQFVRWSEELQRAEADADRRLAARQATSSV
jgi:hypothetical protein